MKLFRSPWLSNTLDKERTSVLRRARSGRFDDKSYLVVLPERGNDILEIIPGFLTREPHYRKSDQKVIGIASSKEEAVELSGGIIARVFHETGALNVAAFIREAEERC